MRLTLKIVLLGLLAVSCPAVSEARSLSDDDVSIINPNYTAISQYSYTVAVLKNNVLLGGGCIIKRRWVLTAVYNTDGFRAQDLKVRIGSNTSTSGGRMYRVTRIVQHPLYNGNWTYDLSLLKLGAAVNLASGRPINALARSPWTGTSTAVVTGFGDTKGSKAEESPGLQVATIHVYNYTTCDNEWYGGSKELRVGEFCAFSPGVGPCWADFGDPVAQCGSDEQSCVLVGIFAGSYGCADDHYPGIYMDVGYFYNWIMNNSKG